MKPFPGSEDQAEAIGQAEENLPKGFWDLPESFIDSAPIRDMYTSLYQTLLMENPDRDTIELMLLERAAALYAYMRSLEASEGYDNTTNYRQLMALWNAMAADLRKTRSVNFDEAKVREEIAREYIEIINVALRGFDPEVANTVRRRMVTALSRS